MEMNDLMRSGAVHVQTNEPENAVIAYRRDADGTLTRLGSHPTSRRRARSFARATVGSCSSRTSRATT